MSFPSGTEISTTNLQDDNGSPALAREDLLLLVQAFNQLVASENSASGVAVLNGSGVIANTNIPSSFSPTGNLSLSPTTGAVSIENALRLTQILTSELGTLAPTDAPQSGDLVYLTDGDAGSPCLSVYDGSNWRIVRLQTTVGDSPADLSVTATLEATADP